MRILALDLGSTTAKTFASFLDQTSGELTRTSFRTTPEEITAICDRLKPDRLVVEATLNTGWVADLIRQREAIELQVAKPTDPVMQTRRTAKTDRNDADLLLKLSASGQLTTVTIPDAATRGWRNLISYRQRLVQGRTRIKNRIKALLRQQGIPTAHQWTEVGMARLTSLARPLSDCPPAEFWRGMLALELDRLRESEQLLLTVTSKLDTVAEPDARVQLLMELPGIGPRSAEALVSAISDPLRFRSGKEIGAYFGLVPVVRQSGQGSYTGRITRAGNGLVRSLLVEISWLGIRRPGWMQDIYRNVLHDDPQRSHRAITAVARRIAVRCWAKLRDQARSQRATAATQPLPHAPAAVAKPA